jgi:hypothetical protein
VVEVLARLVLGGLLVVSAGLKLASPATSRGALATFGFQGHGIQRLVWSGLVAIELGLAAGVFAGLDEAAFAAAALMAIFAATLISALLRGRAGAPCACFGAASRVSARSVARNAALAVAFAALPFLPEGELSTDEWLGLGIVAALLACGGLGLAVLALAREVGMLRLRLGPASALEIPEEGPPLGSRTELVERFPITAETELALAVFTSRDCHVCHGLEPAIDSLANDPVLAVARFEESADEDVWSGLEVPGSPYAIAFGPEGTVLAKGAFNNLAQLESVLGAAERRRAGTASLEALIG